jgi:hypothetical protein
MCSADKQWRGRGDRQEVRVDLSVNGALAPVRTHSARTRQALQEIDFAEQQRVEQLVQAAASVLLTSLRMMLLESRRLRAVGAEAPSQSRERDYWRGVRNREVPLGFDTTGGTEFAPMSTSKDVTVALRYSDRSEKRLLLKLVARSFIDRGASLRYLSAFPEENEHLYPPLTFLRPTGKKDTLRLRGTEYTVVEVEPRFAS